MQRDFDIHQHPVSRRLASFGLLTFLGLWSVLALGQSGVRDLSGTVTDHQHEPLKGAVIQVENGGTLFVASYITDRDGRYNFKRLDGNIDYRIWVEFRGHKSRVKQLSKFDDNKPKILNFVVDLH